MNIQLPPHIVKKDGRYFSELTDRFIPNEKIESICIKYWKGLRPVKKYNSITKRLHPLDLETMQSDIIVKTINPKLQITEMTWEEYQEWKLRKK